MTSQLSFKRNHLKFQALKALGNIGANAFLMNGSTHQNLNHGWKSDCIIFPMKIELFVQRAVIGSPMESPKYSSVEKTKKHETSMKTFEDIARQKDQISSFINRASTKKAITEHEMRICCLIAENNPPIKFAEQIIATNIRLYPTDGILKNVQFGKQKASDMIRDGISISNMQFVHLKYVFIQ